VGDPTPGRRAARIIARLVLIVVRLGVLDVGSNTVHLLVVDAHRGGHPTPMSSTKATLRMAEATDSTGKITRRGADKLVSTIDEFAKIAISSGCAELMAFATSAVRDAENSEDVLARVQKETGVELQVLRGVDESRLTFLAVRRWFGWSAGRIINLDIGGGSLELSSGVDEEPEVALSLPLGAGRLTREWLPDDPPGRRRVAMLRDWLDAELADASVTVLEAGSPELAVATSKTFRSLARLTGAAPSAAGPRVKRTLTANGLRQLISFISRMTTADRAELEGVSAERAPQIVAGALVAEASMRALSIETVDICPWALREGLILRKLDSEADGTALVETSVRDARGQVVDRNAANRSRGDKS
jgi:exopolyphosphatase / guanosine-5'-triphosphate,3'-diphosphate pyrophosphatase